MLTHKQYELLLFIEKKLSETGVSPSFDEMRNSLGLKSKSGIHRLITGLEERGFVRKLPHKARALEVIKLPDNALIKSLNGSKKLETSDTVRSLKLENVIDGGFNSLNLKDEKNSKVINLPLYGKIAAGTPIEALYDSPNSVQVPSSYLGRGDHYALEVEGDSMKDAGILDGDTALIVRADTVENGAIVVAMVDNAEVTLKRIRRKGCSIALEPANSSYKTRICGPDQVKVQGRLVGLIRRY